ncbi:hypothetical protein OJAV_G00119720 [Oryzias javanicus]|uniref:C2 domain-containing protein n=1 Tax=Oryzias javanicus TaxID=123683 RepID=A0A3S2MS41_ORYJA|nr:hypothetical protein OJAV_G00119720 [Oryzias javanicus]
MSLAEQQWCPTSVQVTALQARGLRAKGKSGTNDAYALLQVGKEKFQTSVVEKSVTPVWKEEATFDLPPLQVRGGGGCERSTLQVQVLHRALVGPDKLLGQAVINLPQLSEDTTRNKTEWFRLLDKQGKPDKDRGEVLLDIQFMRNNMTASMFDLTAAGKSRSRLGKFKDKVRGKKKESDSSSGVVPALTQVMTDSEEEANGDGEEEAPKKEGKSKKLKNSSLSGSQSSGLNVDPSEGKKKFKFKIHKRSGSSDSKDLSFGNQKRPSVEQSNICINGSHVYCEEPQPRTSRAGSNFSLASSGHGSMEDVPDNSSPSLDSLRARKEEKLVEEEKIRDEELQRCDPALVSEGSCPVSCEETDPIRTQREKRPAPRPPGSDQDGKQRWKSQDVDERAQINKLNPESDVRTVDVVSARLMKKIPQQNKPPADSKNTQSLTATSDVITAKHAKRPAPSRPQPVSKDSSELKTISPAEKIPQMGATEKEQVLPIHSSNPFEDELSDQEDSSVSAPACWPPALTQTADGDAASQVKLKSSKMARAPAPPPKSDGDDIINKGLADANDQQRDGTGHLHVNNGPYQDSQHIKTPEKPPSSRRLLPVKPLNPSDQHSNSLFQEDTKSPGIVYELQAKNKVDDTVMTGPYSQLTREELICLVLKQESQLLEKQGKISELEQYIDNLLVRVMEEQPSILMSLSAAPKKVA